MRFFVLPIFDGVIMDGHPIFWVVDTGVHHSKYWMPIHYDTIEDGQNKKSHLLFSLLVGIVSLMHFIGGIYLSKILLHHFISFIWIITPLLKINVSIQDVCVDVSRDTRSLRVLNTQLPRVTAERAIHYGVMDMRSFGQNQWNFLLTC